MIGEWIRFGLCAAFLLAGLFIMVVSIIGLYRFDFALQRIHAAALGDTLSLLLFLTLRRLNLIDRDEEHRRHEEKTLRQHAAPHETHGEEDSHEQ